MMLLYPGAASAQRSADPAQPVAIQTTAAPQNVPPRVQEAEDSIERVFRRFGIGFEAGVGLDPQLIDFGAHATFGPIFHRNVQFRPGVEVGAGEVTTTFGVNLDVLYLLPGTARQTRWLPYVGAGPNFGLSHRAFEGDTDQGRFDFSDTDFEAGLNFIAGVRNRTGGMFVEMKATAYGVSNVKLLVGFTF
jgi:hypothetical protein